MRLGEESSYVLKHVIISILSKVVGLNTTAFNVFINHKSKTVAHFKGFLWQHLRFHFACLDKMLCRTSESNIKNLQSLLEIQ